MLENARWISRVAPPLGLSCLFKFIVACGIVLALTYWRFDMNELTKTVKIASLRLPWRSEVINSSEQENEMSLISNSVPEDVITDSKRAKSVSRAFIFCPLIPPKLVGDIPVKMDVPSLEAVEDEFPDVMPGGRFRPKECTSRHRVAILVPIQEPHRSTLRYSPTTFTKYFLDNRSTTVSSSLNRLQNYGYKIFRRPQNVARYATLAHVKSKPSEQRMGLLDRWASRITTDGLNSLKYKRLDMKFNKLYTWILADLREPE
ncbi:hypothetical protein MTO96_023686 [Rhipicephalus appendiculatus]